MQFLKLALASAIPCLALARMHDDNDINHASANPLKKRAIADPIHRVKPRQVIGVTALGSVTTAVSVVVVDVYPTISTSTILSTSTVTVHQCPATVLDCPARSRSVAYVTSVVPVSISLCPTTYVSYSFSAMPTTYASSDALSSSFNGTYGISTTVITHTPGPTIYYTPVSTQAPPATPIAYTNTAPTAVSQSSIASINPSSLSTPAAATTSTSYGLGYNASYHASSTFLTTGSSGTAISSLALSNLSAIATPPTYPSSLLPAPYGVTPTSTYTSVVSISGKPAYTLTYTSVGLPTTGALSSLQTASLSAPSSAGYTVVVGGPSSSFLTTVIPYGSSQESVLPLVTPSSSASAVPGYTVVVGPGPSTYFTTVIPYGPASTPASSAASYTIIVGGPSSTLTTEVPAYSISSSRVMTYPASGYTTIVYPGHDSSSLITTVIPVTGFTTGPAAPAATPVYTLPPSVSSPAPGYSASIIIPGSTTVIIPAATYEPSTMTPVATSTPFSYGNQTVTQTAAPSSYTGDANKHVVACVTVMLSLALAVLAA